MIFVFMEVQGSSIPVVAELVFSIMVQAMFIGFATCEFKHLSFYVAANVQWRFGVHFCGRLCHGARCARNDVEPTRRILAALPRA